MIRDFSPFLNTIGGVIIGFLIVVIKDWIQGRMATKEQLRYDTFQKRTALYEEIVNALSAMTSIEQMPMNIYAGEMRLKKIECVHELKTFINRLWLLNGGGAARILFSLNTEIQREPEYGPDEMAEGPYAASLRAAFYNAVRNGLSDLTEYAGKEAEAPFPERWVNRIRIGVNDIKKKYRNAAPKVKSWKHK